MEQDFELPTFRPKHSQELIVPSFELGEPSIEFNFQNSLPEKAPIDPIPAFKTLRENESIENIKVDAKLAKDGFDSTKVNPMQRTEWMNAGFENSPLAKKKAGVLQERDEISKGVTSVGGKNLYTGMGDDFYKDWVGGEEGGSFWRDVVLKSLDDAAKDLLGFEGDWNSEDAWAQWGKKTGAKLLEKGANWDGTNDETQKDWIKEGGYSTFSIKNSYAASASKTQNKNRPRSVGGYKSPKILQHPGRSEVAEFAKESEGLTNSDSYSGWYLVAQNNTYISEVAVGQQVPPAEDGAFGYYWKVGSYLRIGATTENGKVKRRASFAGLPSETVDESARETENAGKFKPDNTKKVVFNTALSQIIRSLDLQTHYYIAWFETNNSIWVGENGTAFFYIDKFSIGKILPGDVIKRSYGFIDVALTAEGAAKGDSKISFELLETAFMDVRKVFEERTGVTTKNGHIGDPGVYKKNNQDNRLNLHIVSPFGWRDKNPSVMHITSKDLRVIKIPGMEFTQASGNPKPIKLEFTCRKSTLKIETV